MGIKFNPLIFSGLDIGGSGGDGIGANTLLSNLGTTAINAHLLMDTANTYTLGTAAVPMFEVHSTSLLLSELGLPTGGLVDTSSGNPYNGICGGRTANVALINLAAVGTDDDLLVGTVDLNSGSGGTGGMYIQTGDTNSPATGTSGALRIETGESDENSTGSFSAQSGSCHGTTQSSGLISVSSGSYSRTGGTGSSGPATLTSGSANLGASQTSGDVTVKSGTANTGSGKTGEVHMFSGNQGGTGDSGSVNITVGSSAGGTQGEIKLLKTDLPPTVGHVFTCTNVDGSGYYAAAAAAGANDTLSNLASPVALNQALLPGTANTIGSSSSGFNFIYSFNLVSGAQIQMGNGLGAGRAFLKSTNDTTPSGNSTGVSWAQASSNLGIFTEGTSSKQDIYIETNNNASGDSGGLLLQTGTATGTRGGVSIDTNKLDVSAVTEGVGLPVWKKVTVGHAALQAAALTNDIELLSLPAGASIHAVTIKHTTALAGTGVTAYTTSIGISGDLTKYASAFDVFQATGGTVAQATSVFDVEDFGGVTSIRIAATSVGANLDQSSAGSIDVYILMSTLPV